MVRNTGYGFVPAPTPAAVWAVIEGVVTRRMMGEHVPDETIISQHPGLMPYLGRELAALRHVEAARGAASDSHGGGSTIRWDASRKPELVEEPLESFPGYEVHEAVGRGASGVVYRALQTATRREVAIKAVFEGPFSGPNDRARFEREARILAQLHHPHIVAVHDTGWTQHRYFLVMDFVDGEALDLYVEHQGLSVEDQLKLFAEVCEAVHAAHLRGVIHRDLKPRNILVDKGGQPRLVDFGLAKLSDDTIDPVFSTHVKTMTGQFVGSLPWASPEQAAGSSERIDIRSDIYSLGVVFYQILTGRFPYSVVGNLRDVVDRILTAEPARPSRPGREIDDEVETILLKSLAKDRERRYQSAGDLARDIRRHLADEPIEAKRDSAWYVLRKTLRRHRWTVAASLAFLTLAGAYAVTVSVLYRMEQDAARRAHHTLDFLSDTVFSASSHRLGADATLEEVLDVTAARLTSEFKGDPLAAAKLHYAIGSAYETIWKKSEGAAHLRAAARLYESQLGADHPDTIAARVYLGMVLAEMRDRAGVEMLRQTVEAAGRLPSAHTRLVAEAKANLGFSLWAAHEPPLYDEAERTYNDARELFQKSVGPDSLELARMLTGWASMRIAQHRFDEALAISGEADRMARRFVGEDHQFLLESAINRSEALHGAGRFAESETVLAGVVSQAGRRFGAHQVPRLLRRMSVLRQLQGDMDGAVQQLHEAIAHSCRQLAAQHPEERNAWSHLADSLTATAQDDLSVERYRGTVVAVFERTQDADEAVKALLARAELAIAQSRPRDADTLLGAARTLCEHLAPASRRLRGIVDLRSADAAALLGETARVESFLLDAVGTYRSLIGPDAAETRNAVQTTVRFYENQGRDADARKWSTLLNSPTDAGGARRE